MNTNVNDSGSAPEKGWDVMRVAAGIETLRRAYETETDPVRRAYYFNLLAEAECTS